MRPGGDEGKESGNWIPGAPKVPHSGPPPPVFSGSVAGLMTGAEGCGLNSAEVLKWST